jgi:hypothetical protein
MLADDAGVGICIPNRGNRNGVFSVGRSSGLGGFSGSG